MNLEEINKSLKTIAYNKTVPFCYMCYIQAPSGKCEKCNSDDNMRLLPEYGCEYGIDWVIEILINQNLSPIDEKVYFEQMIEDVYPETIDVGFMNLSTVTVMKEQDPIAWRIARCEYIESLAEDGELLTFDNGANYFCKYEVEAFIEENLEEEMA